MLTVDETALLCLLREYLYVDTTSTTGLRCKKAPRTRTPVGAEAFTSKSNRGYYHGMLRRRNLQAHRVVFALTSGFFPPVVDHINGQRDDNRPENLRAANVLINNHNREAKGYYPFRGGYMARIAANGKQAYLGVYPTENEAREAYLKAKARLHPTTPAGRLT
ncbi:HNH endonuclease [Klebsiella phage NKA196]|nr:HNH endonuclease [Klebsiella phage NKA196]